MGYVAEYSGTDTISLTNPKYEVTLRQCLSRTQLAQAEALLTQAVVDMNGNGSVKPDVTRYRDMMVFFSIVSWNLDDEAGNPIPVTPTTVGVLSGPDFDLVWERVDALNKGMNPAEQQRFPVAS